MDMITKEDLSKKYDAAISIKVSPDDNIFPRYNDGDVIDEDQSVRWNKEEVERRRKARKDEGERLRKLRIKAWGEFRDLSINFIRENSNTNNAQAALIYDKAYEAHFGGFEDLYHFISDYIDFFINLEEVGKEK